MLIARHGKPSIALDFRERAPRGATRAMYMQSGVAKTASRYGALAVAVPGEVAGCAAAVRRFGQLPLSKVVAPAVRLAARGFRVAEHLARSSQRYFTYTAKRFGPARFAALATLLTPRGKPLGRGQTMRRPQLARTLHAIGRSGGTSFYRGWIARDIVSTVRAAGGLLTLEDMASYKVVERKPLLSTYRGYQIHTMPPPSSGGVALIAALHVLEQFDLKKLGHNGSAYLHLLAEAFKHVFADRARFLGDPDYVKVPVVALLARQYAKRLAAKIGRRVHPIQTYGWKSAARASSRDGGTSHLSVIDRWGTAVSMTTSINTGFGALLLARKSGVILNNTMDDFATHPGKPNFFGLVQGEQNAVAAKKRPLSSMTPTIVTKNGRTKLIVGGSGGPTIITGTLQVLLNVLDFGMDPADAVARSRIHHQWLPDRLWVEQDLPVDVVRALEKEHGQKPWLQRHPFTAVQAVTARGTGFDAASDPRKAGAPAGY